MGPGPLASPPDDTRGAEPPSTGQGLQSRTGRESRKGPGHAGRGVEAGLAEPHLFEEHDLQPVGEVQALVVWAEGHGEVLRLARVHDALDRDHAEHALAAVVLSACGSGGAASPPPLVSSVPGGSSGPPPQSAARFPLRACAPAPAPPAPPPPPALRSHLAGPCPAALPGSRPPAHPLLRSSAPARRGTAAAAAGLRSRSGRGCPAAGRT